MWGANPCAGEQREIVRGLVYHIRGKEKTVVVTSQGYRLKQDELQLLRGSRESALLSWQFDEYKQMVSTGAFRFDTQTMQM